MSAALAHRGPDGEGSWMDHRAALAHRMLWTTAESLTEVQPVVRQREGLTLVADARIDNREELIALLGASGGADVSDSDLIAAAYIRWGVRCVERLIGDFAFAMWNARDRSFFCARDPMGIKPFYYLTTERLFAFASEMKAILALPGVRATIDEEQLALFLACALNDPARTIYRELRRLPAGHTLLVSGGVAKLSRYWTPESSPDVRFARDRDYVEAFRDRFAVSVAARLRSSHPVGATLSGGLDSSSIVCMARALRGPDASALDTFSVVFPHLPEWALRLIDERSYIDAVIGGGGVEPHLVNGEGLTPLRDLDRTLWHLDEPHAAPNLYLHWGMFEAAQASGVRVLLDGFDGDSAISHGFGRLTGLTRAGDLRTLESELALFSAHHGTGADLALREYVLPHLGDLARRGEYRRWAQLATLLARRFSLARRELLRTYGLRQLMPATLLGFTRAVRDRDVQERSLLRSHLARHVRRQTKRSAVADWRRVAPSEREAHIEGLSQPLYQLTLDIADKSAAAFGIEPRYPFFDRRVIEFCLGLPEEQKFADGWPRVLLRRAMEGILPPAVQWRTSKANLSPNFHDRFHAVDVTGRRQTGDGSAIGPYLRRDRLDGLFDRYRATPRPNEMKREALTLFRALILERWLQGVSTGNPQSRIEGRLLSHAAA
jgi:asparagine synthase (glutamine-hydrolysing)